MREVTSSATASGSGTDRQRAVRSRLLDLGLVVVLLAAGLLEAFLRPSSGAGFSGGADLGVVVATVAIALPLAWRRRYPIQMIALSAVAYLGALFAGYQNTSAADSAQLIAIYSVGVYAMRPAADRARWVMGVAIVGGLVWAHHLGEFSLAEISTMIATWVGSLVFGETVFIRRRYQAALEERARLLEADRDERARVAVQEERARISREFHDIWAHTLSVVVVQAGAGLEVFDESPEQARLALSRIREAGRRSLAEVRRVIASDTGEGALGTRAPAPGLADLDRLVDELGRAGVPVAVSVSTPIDDLPADVDLSAFRIVQQALTNTLLHAGSGASARVEVSKSDGNLLIDVLDDGRGSPEPPDPSRPRGRGLIGMRERVALFGGDVRAGPESDGGFAVHARIPVGEGE